MDQVTLCNLALARLGTASSISTLTEASTEAQACALFWQQAVDATFQAYDWRFATARQVLALQGAAPHGWRFQYALPADCVKPRHLEWLAPLPVAGATLPAPPMLAPYAPAPFPHRHDRRHVIRFEIATAPVPDGLLPVLLTDLNPALLTYTTNALSVAYWPPEFNTAFTWQLAAEMAVAITGNGALGQQMKAGYDQAIMGARMQDANASTLRDEHTPDWIETRHEHGWWPGYGWELGPWP